MKYRWRWSRTYRSRAVTFSPTSGAQESRNGMRIVPDEIPSSWPAEHLLPPIQDRQPAGALDDAIHAITARYGRRTAEFVAMQLEYPTSGAGGVQQSELSSFDYQPGTKGGS